MIQFEWKPASEIPSERWERNSSVSPQYLVKCGYTEDRISIIGYARYSYASKSWMSCYDFIPKIGPSTWFGKEVIEWTDKKL